MVHRLDERLIFPLPEHGPRRGPIAVGGDLRPERLLLAYSMGIFPWQGDPLHWHSPDPRMVLPVDALRVSHTLAKTIRQKRFRLTLDAAFTEVMAACATVPRLDQEGSWITPAMVDAYSELHRRGLAHSAEAWHGNHLAGGLYGVSLGSVFFGESMFTRERDASKVAFVGLVRQLRVWGITLIDCQVHTPHLQSLGAREWPRRTFLRVLREALERPTRRGLWRFDLNETSVALSDPAAPSGAAHGPRRQSRGNRPGAGSRGPTSDR